MSSSINYTRNRVRSGFTLVELLIVITIIGLLVGLLAVVGGGVISGAREFSVNSEIIQMSQSVEKFNTQYGFYPPSFEQFKRTVNTVESAPLTVVKEESAQMLPYLNKISPNHQEFISPSPILSRASAGYTRLDDWWEFVGCNLDQTTSLQFWLAGLFQNKQFPLTGGLTPTISGNSDLYIAAAYNIDFFVDGMTAIPPGFDREVFFEFETERFAPVEIVAGPADGVSNPALVPVSQYIMEYGKTNGDLFYVYRDSDSYLPAVQLDSSHLDANCRSALSGTVAKPELSDFANLAAFEAYAMSPNHRGPAYYFLNPVGVFPPAMGPSPEFANPNTFQIISFGLDGDPGIPAASVNRGRLFGLTPALRGQIFQGLGSDDNLCNFADGRLEKFIDDSQ